MRVRKANLLPIFLVPFLVSCQTYWAYKGAENAWKSGRYMEAAFGAVETIMLDRDNEKAGLLLEKSYPQAVEETLAYIGKIEASGTDMKLTAVADSWITLSKLNDAVRHILPLHLKKEKRTVKLTLREFPSETAAAREKAAGENYDRAIEYSNGTGREANKQAYLYFSRCLVYVPNYRDAAEKAAQSKKDATARILITPTEEKGSRAYSLDPADIVYDTMLTTVSKGISGKEFSQIVERSRMDRIMAEKELQLSDLFDPATATNVGTMLGANTLLLSQVTGVVYDPPQVSVTTKTLVKRIPIAPANAAPAAAAPVVAASPVEAVVVNPEKISYREARGTLTVFTSVASVKVHGSYRFIDAETSGIIATEAFTCEKKDVQTWAQYSGDEEALEDQDRTLIGNTPVAVSFESLLLEASKDLGYDIGRSVLKKLD